ncbi:hypothetical protein BLSMQ_0190 [Brevibacterium aurantiacum]|uniref:Uncharacterized protein n=1 Tax=Brevibacterium aurantiacum TaxID=273384 RepID=A0A1D7VYX5_BREAU|nr:hypothetical protein BLSMQ_0190 [Brevibacterium aurantiacum]
MGPTDNRRLGHGHSFESSTEVGQSTVTPAVILSSVPVIGQHESTIWNEECGPNCAESRKQVYDKPPIPGNAGAPRHLCVRSGPGAPALCR